MIEDETEEFPEAPLRRGRHGRLMRQRRLRVEREREVAELYANLRRVLPRRLVEDGDGRSCDGALQVGEELDRHGGFGRAAAEHLVADFREGDRARRLGLNQLLQLLEGARAAVAPAVNKEAGRPL